MKILILNGILDFGEDVNANGRLDAEPLNDDLGSDGLGPDFFEYTGPDLNGTEANGSPDLGEPNFEFTDNDESDQVGLTSFYLREYRKIPEWKTTNTSGILKFLREHLPQFRATNQIFLMLMAVVL